MKPYYDDGQITIYHGDCREILPTLEPVDLVLTDPPYGINYASGQRGAFDGIVGDSDTELRDWLIRYWCPRQMACFATWRCQPPVNPRGCLVWDKGAGVGMGDLTFPWSPNYEMVWVFGNGWAGHRGGSILRSKTVVSWNTGPVKRLHPNEKPIDLLCQLLLKAPNADTILDPFMGSGTTLRAAKDLGRKAIGIEIEEKYCEIAAKRMPQMAMQL